MDADVSCNINKCMHCNLFYLEVIQSSMQGCSPKAADLLFGVFSISCAFSESAGKCDPFPLPPLLSQQKAQKKACESKLEEMCIHVNI